MDRGEGGGGGEVVEVEWGKERGKGRREMLEGDEEVDGGVEIGRRNREGEVEGGGGEVEGCITFTQCAHAQVRLRSVDLSREQPTSFVHVFLRSMQHTNTSSGLVHVPAR